MKRKFLLCLILAITLVTTFLISGCNCLSSGKQTENVDNPNSASAVINLIDALPSESELELSDEEAVVSARNKYTRLDDATKKQVTNLSKLEALENKLAELKIYNDEYQYAQNVVIKINRLPDVEELYVTDGDLIVSVRQEYDGLSAKSKEFVSNYNKLLLLEERIVVLNIDNDIYNLPEADSISLSDKESVVELRAKYNALAEQDKILVTNITKLTELENRIYQLENSPELIDLAQPVIDEINALPSVEQLTMQDKTAVETARQNYQMLSADVKLVVNNLNKLTALENRLVVLQEEEDAKAVAQSLITQINALPEITAVELTDKTAVATVRANYNNLTELQKSFVSNYSKLQELELKIAQFEGTEEYKAQAQTVVNKINTLPSATALTLANEADVIEARTLYNNLNESAKQYVTNLNTLVELENKMAELKSSQSSSPVTNGFITTTYVTGYTLQNNVYTITGAGEYYFKGSLTDGQIYVNAPEQDVVLYLNGVTMQSQINSCIFIEDANKVTVFVVEGTENTLTDNRALKTAEDLTQGSATIYAKSDLTIKGTGKLTVYGSYYNAIHTKNDVRISDVTLYAKAPNNSIKGNDSITINSGNITAISTGGNGLKTDNSDISTKGNQRGTISILGGTVNIYSALDGIDASYDVVIDGASTVVNIYTDTYSGYTENVIVSSTTNMYIRVKSTYYSASYRYAVMFYNSSSDYVFADASYKESAQSGSSTYYYYVLDMPTGYTNFAVYRYLSSQVDNSTTTYNAKTEGGTINTSKDMYSISSISGTSISGSWSTYTTQSSGGMGGMGGSSGNTNKSEYSAKGIKADNVLSIVNGTITIKANDDGLHGKYGTALGNGATGLGNVSISGGNITITSSDDGIHADYTLSVSGGTILVTTAYEGLEGNLINISGGQTTITATDDGVNCAGTIATPLITVSGGVLDVSVGTGDVDGIDSNGSYLQTGGVVIARNACGDTSGNMGSIDADGTITVSGGTMIAAGTMGGTLSNSVNRVSWGNASGGGMGGGRPGQNSSSSSATFTAGTYTVSGTNITFTLNASYASLTIASDSLITNSSYTLTNGSVTKTWTQSSNAVSGS